MKSSKASLFLMELVIVILFFALSSAVCIQLFVKAHAIDQETVNMNHSVIWIQNLSESFLAFDGDMEQVKELYKETDSSGASDTLTLCFDKDWNMMTPLSSKSEWAFEVTLQLSGLPGSDRDESLLTQTDADPSDSVSGGYIVRANITVTPLGTHTPLYEQQIERYVQRKGAKNG